MEEYHMLFSYKNCIEQYGNDYKIKKEIQKKNLGFVLY